MSLYPEIPIEDVEVDDFVNDYNTGYSGPVVGITREAHPRNGCELVVLHILLAVGLVDELAYRPGTLIGVSR